METDQQERQRLETAWGLEFMGFMDKYCTSPDPRDLLDSLTSREQLLVIYITLSSDVENGGFRYYLQNTFGRFLMPAKQILQGKCNPAILRILHDVEQLVDPDSFFFNLNGKQQEQFLCSPPIEPRLETLDVEFDGLEEEFYRDIKPYLTGEKEM